MWAQFLIPPEGVHELASPDCPSSSLPKGQSLLCSLWPPGVKWVLSKYCSYSWTVSAVVFGQHKRKGKRKNQAWTQVAVTWKEKWLWPCWVCIEHDSDLASASFSLVTFLSSASTALSMQNNSVFGDLKSDEMELLYSAYGDETGVQCALR